MTETATPAGVVPLCGVTISQLVPALAAVTVKFVVPAVLATLSTCAGGAPASDGAVNESEPGETVSIADAGTVRVMQDGVAENYTAAMSRPYRDAQGTTTASCA